ncbi:UDP-glucose--hexose-1-phosphate uridylyltransferase [Priestia koreensis]|uniref:UDP-glucose--hexose-1-phosphate uridylyltransferase n=1 Tax=Priestia koreensis TaxID=284581 RepID=UPI001F5915F6|nr:UDP-glucose--hexose-1-phosphate uridylyltransferase [Priestia koreensis]MCM3006034.1 UDP-glucose--hexose-1-phosphate uridylyltransferase [Priestia koreensis]UNL85375.1 UDP-glucose--hexose-1-phosphate uridylyltransferase [Priestia koreensis]
MSIYASITQLVNAAIKKQLIQREDEIYARNQVAAALHLQDFVEEPVTEEKSIPDLLEELTQYALDKGIIDDLLDEKEIFGSNVMNIFISKPSEVNQTFYQKYAQSPSLATDYFYQLSQDSNYIQTKRIAKNISYQVETEFGELDITINLSKPEKDPKQIALEKEKAKSNPSVGYPKCLLCVENEGYEGRIGHPARSNHRMIRMELTEEQWFLQYSPYVYYNEHCILLSGEHRDMKINESAFRRLLTFVEKVPHYFVGSNADLPIVGGSILTHDHYQGGNYEFAMAKAPEEFSFTLNDYADVTGAIVKWPMSVIRLKGKEKESLVKASTFILDSWIKYEDESLNIHSHTGETRHNTITPIARQRDGVYEVDLVLRNNRTNEEHPLGIFHPHQDVQHIKKENIGLIEVMGLAVLPARLKEELLEVEKYLLNEPNELAAYHKEWGDQLRETYASTLSASTVGEIVRKELGMKFLRVLRDAGVFKRDEKGQDGFKRFINSLNQ